MPRKSQAWNDAVRRPKGDADDRAEQLSALDPLDLEPEIQRTRAVIDLALEDLNAARKRLADWQTSDAAKLGKSPPSLSGELTSLLRALEVCGKLQRAFAQNRAQDAVPRAQVVEAFSRIVALAHQYFPDGDHRKAFLDACARIPLGD
jgi:hypothetical protein